MLALRDHESNQHAIRHKLHSIFDEHDTLFPNHDLEDLRTGFLVINSFRQVGSTYQNKRRKD